MAVKKKERQVAAGAPAWMVTYGDLVTLLLTFFVMLLAMSEVKKDERFVDFMQAIKAAFGYVGGVRSIPPDFTQIPQNVQLATLLVIPPNPHDLSQSPDEGVRGKRRRVTYIRPGKQFAVGSPVWFPPLSAALDEAQLAKIAAQAKQLEGHSTLIEVRALQPPAGGGQPVRGSCRPFLSACPGGLPGAGALQDRSRAYHAGGGRHDSAG